MEKSTQVIKVLPQPKRKLNPPRRLRAIDVSVNKSDEWSNEYPAYISIRGWFKTKAERQIFERKVREILDGKL